MRSKIRICTDLNNIVNRVARSEMTVDQFSHIAVSQQLKEEITADYKKIKELEQEYLKSFGEPPQKRPCGKLYSW
ncbi:MAG: hypothetical protein FWE33_04930 [Defluviitaleaceae bacterium]|nr:hypothetical protein [Defluviitaleaceae bacterium]